MESLKKLVAVKIRFLRTNAGMSQKKLAEKSKLSVRYIAKVELEPLDIGLVNLEKIARGLGVSPAELLVPIGHSNLKPSKKIREAVKATITLLSAMIDGE